MNYETELIILQHISYVSLNYDTYGIALPSEPINPTKYVTYLTLDQWPM